MILRYINSIFTFTFTQDSSKPLEKITALTECDSIYNNSNNTRIVTVIINRRKYRGALFLAWELFFLFLFLVFIIMLSYLLTAYLHSLLKHYVPSRSLRSSDSNLLFVPGVRTCFGSRSSHHLETLLSDIRNSPSICCFRHHLRTFFYNPAFRPS